MHATGITILIVTHEPDVAAFCERVVSFQDGKVVEDRATPNPRLAADVLAELPRSAAPSVNDRGNRVTRPWLALCRTEPRFPQLHAPVCASGLHAKFLNERPHHVFKRDAARRQMTVRKHPLISGSKQMAFGMKVSKGNLALPLRVPVVNQNLVVVRIGHRVLVRCQANRPPATGRIPDNPILKVHSETQRGSACHRYRRIAGKRDGEHVSLTVPLDLRHYLREAGKRKVEVGLKLGDCGVRGPSVQTAAAWPPVRRPVDRLSPRTRQRPTAA